ncbi:MAG: PA0069 family radical SAM protein [Nitrospiraceae bacterium]
MRTITNPPNPYESQHRDWLEAPPAVHVQVFEDDSREILTRNESPDLPFRWSVNPYRGCFHACAYCYARPSHEYWGFGAGTDFDSKLIIKPEAPALLRRTFMRPSWRGELIVFSGNTDCYQPLEAAYGLTQSCLEVCAEFHNPVGIITKSALIQRDLDLLRRLRDEAWLRVYVSIPFADAETARKVEPHVPSPAKRLATVEALAKAGIPTGVSLAPIIPGLNDQDIPALLMQAKTAGADEAFYTLLRLSANVEPVFLERMADAFPDRIDKIRHRLMEVRGGRLSDSRFHCRHEGTGAYWNMIENLFTVSARKAGFPEPRDVPIPQTFRRSAVGQMALF